MAAKSLNLIVFSVFLTVLVAAALVAPGHARAEGFDVNAATDAYLATVPAADRAKSDAYFEGGYWLLLWGTLYGLAVSWVFLHFGIARKFREWGEKVTRFKFIHTVIFMIPYLIAGFVFGFPWNVYTGFFREHQYGLATQTFEPWFSDQLIGLGVNLVLLSLFVAVLYWVINRYRKTWWLIGGAVTAAFMMFAITIAPVFIAPLFNTYLPLDDGPVKSEILSLARANGVPADNVYWFDASAQTTRISANVSGMFGTTRISVNDNLLNNATLAEIKAVVGHEIGHYVTNLIIALVIPLSLVAVVGFGFVKGTFEKVHKKYGAKWGVRDIADPAGLPLFAALISVFFLAMTPVTNTIIRENERFADIFGLNAAREPDAFATTALKLSSYRKLDPSPVEEFIFYDHPSGRSRIFMAMEWKAENLADEGCESDVCVYTEPSPETQ